MEQPTNKPVSSELRSMFWVTTPKMTYHLAGRYHDASVFLFLRVYMIVLLISCSFHVSLKITKSMEEQLVRSR